MERVGRARAMRGGIGERADELELLDGRARPAVADDERQCVLVLRTDMNEMDVQPIDLGHELREGVQPRLALAPVVLGRPVAGELLHESRAARPASHRRPSRARATWSRRCAGATRPGPPREPRRGKAGWWRSRSPRLAMWDVDRPWCSQALPLPLIGAGDNPTGNPSTVQDLRRDLLCRHGACGPPSVVGAGPRSRPTTGQSEWTVRADSRGPAAGRLAAASLTGRWSGRWAGPDAAGRGS